MYFKLDSVNLNVICIKNLYNYTCTMYMYFKLDSVNLNVYLHYKLVQLYMHNAHVFQAPFS